MSFPRTQHNVPKLIFFLFFFCFFFSIFIFYILKDIITIQYKKYKTVKKMKNNTTKSYIAPKTGDSSSALQKAHNGEFSILNW